MQHDVLLAMNAQGWGIPNLGVTDDSELGGPAMSDAAANYGHLLLLGPADPGFSTTPSEMPGALIEPLFITDPFEGSIAANVSGQAVIAGGLAQAVQQYFAPAAPGGRIQRPPSRRGTRRSRGRPPDPVRSGRGEISAFWRTAALTPAARQVA